MTDELGRPTEEEFAQQIAPDSWGKIRTITAWRPNLSHRWWTFWRPKVVLVSIDIRDDIAITQLQTEVTRLLEENARLRAALSRP